MGSSGEHTGLRQQILTCQKRSLSVTTDRSKARAVHRKHKRSLFFCYRVWEVDADHSTRSSVIGEQYVSLPQTGGFELRCQSPRVLILPLPKPYKYSYSLSSSFLPAVSNTSTQDWSPQLVETSKCFVAFTAG